MSFEEQDRSRPGTPASEKSSATKRTRVQDDQINVSRDNGEKKGALSKDGARAGDEGSVKALEQVGRHGI